MKFQFAKWCACPPEVQFLAQSLPTHKMSHLKVMHIFLVTDTHHYYSPFLLPFLHQLFSKQHLLVQQTGSCRTVKLNQLFSKLELIILKECVSVSFQKMKNIPQKRLIKPPC